MEYEWLPDAVARSFRRMIAEGSLNEREQAFFTDSKLKKFWGRVGVYLSSVRADYRSNAAEQLVAGFLVPRRFGYGETGKANNPVFKINIRKAQQEADPKIERIARLTGELESTVQFYPDGTELLPIVKQLIDDDALKNLPSYYGRVRTSEALRILETSFSKYPEADKLFNEVPGMASQKSSWADWMREAEANMQEALCIWPGKLQLKESDWVNLAQVLISMHITRSAVQAARKSSKSD